MGYRDLHRRLRTSYGIRIPQYVHRYRKGQSVWYVFHYLSMFREPSTVLFFNVLLQLRDVVARMLAAIDAVGVEQRSRRHLI